MKSRCHKLSGLNRQRPCEARLYKTKCGLAASGRSPPIVLDGNTVFDAVEKRLTQGVWESVPATCWRIIRNPADTSKSLQPFINRCIGTITWRYACPPNIEA